MADEMTHEELKVAHADLQKRHADVMEGGGSYNNLQVALDAALQKHKDDAEAHAAGMAALIDAHTKEIAARDAAMSLLQKQHEEKLKGFESQFRQSLSDQATALGVKHASEISELKKKHILPVVLSEQKRRMEEMERANQEQISELQ